MRCGLEVVFEHELSGGVLGFRKGKNQQWLFGFCLEKLRRKLGVGIGRLWGALMAPLATHLFVSHETEQINTVPTYSLVESSGPKVIW